jgi:hypothetical protein
MRERIIIIILTHYFQNPEAGLVANRPNGIKSVPFEPILQRAGDLLQAWALSSSLLLVPHFALRSFFPHLLPSSFPPHPCH